MIKKIIVTILFFLMLPVSCFATVTTIEDFNALNTAKLDGQDGWALSAGTTNQWQVAGATGGVSPEEGAKMAYTNSGTSENEKKTVTAETTGHNGLWMYIQSSGQTDGNRNHFVLYNGATVVGQLRYQYVSGSTNSTLVLINGLGSGVDIISGISVNAWHNFDIGFDPPNGNIRVRVDGGAWSSWFSAGVSFTQIDHIELQAEPNGAGLEPLDDIYYDDEQAAAATTQADFGILNFFGNW